MESPSPSPSPSPSKVKVIKQAIKQVMEEVDDDDDHHRLLSKLMSQLERLEAEPEADAEGLSCPAVSKVDSMSDDEATKVNSNVSRLEEEERERIAKELAKELKKVKRQNLITHCLLSVMIVLTIAWQISEISIILKLKNGVSQPFRSVGSMFKGLLKPFKANGNEEEFKRLLKPFKANGNEEETESSSITKDLIESSPSHDLKIPELPHVDLPKIDLGFEDEDKD